jgi:exportin-1
VALFETNRDANKFKLALRDFLIQLTEFGASETEQNELFLDEREAEQEAKRKQEIEAALRIPGLVKPSDLPTMDEDD